MDTFRTIAGRLTFLLLLTVVSVFAAPRSAHADTYDQAMAKCQADSASQNYVVTFPPKYFSNPASCSVDGHFGSQVISEYVVCKAGNACAGQTSWIGGWPFTGSPPLSPCDPSNLPSMSGGYAGKITASMTWCNRNVPTGDGSTVSCSMAFTPSGPPTMNQWGSWHTPGTLTSSGDTCDGSGSGSNSWKDAQGNAPVPAPPSPSDQPPVSPSPQICGGGSCYDPNTDQACAVADGKQICVSGVSARSSAGSCVSSGDSTICAGSPSAPRPPLASVPDPPSAIRDSDSYTQADPTTGANQVVTVNTYTNVGGDPLSSGQKSGDSGPAPASSSGGSQGSVGGGGDCNSPPVCSGDAVMCGVVLEQWRTMCSAKQGTDQLHKDIAGDGNGPSDFDALKTKYSQSDVWVPASTGNTEGDQANAGSYNQGGFGYSRECPLKDMPLVSLPFSIPFSLGCDVLEACGYVAVAFALFAAACITAGSNR